jgi:hypothetical protein
MLFRETVAVYCENHTEHINTLCGQKTQFVPHRKHITSKPNRVTTHNWIYKQQQIACNGIPESENEELDNPEKLLWYPQGYEYHSLKSLL